MTHRVLVAGAPRSGTTWVAETLATAADTAFVHEPDNHRLWPIAALAKEGIGTHPALTLDDDLPVYDALWENAYAGGDNQARPGWFARKAAIKGVPKSVTEALVRGQYSSATTAAKQLFRAAPKAPPRPNAGHVVVKSVHSAFALERNAQGADVVVVVRRDHRNAVASWLDLGWLVPRYEKEPNFAERVLGPADLEPPARGSATVENAWAYALLHHGFTSAAAKHPEWIVVEHEDLCDDVVGNFGTLFEQAGLPWSDATTNKLVEGDKAGDGYKTNRVAADQRDRWRKRLDERQVAEVASVLARFGQS